MRISVVMEKTRGSGGGLCVGIMGGGERGGSAGGGLGYGRDVLRQLEVYVVVEVTGVGFGIGNSGEFSSGTRGRLKEIVVR